MTEILEQETDAIATTPHPSLRTAGELREHVAIVDLVEEELVEDISIDGMCGVY